MGGFPEPPQPIELPVGGLDDGAVAIRPFRIEDAPVLVAGIDADVVRFASLKWADATADRLADEIAADWPARAREGRAASLSIRDARTDDLDGYFLVYNVDRWEGRCEIGFWVLPHARGQGVASRAVGLIARWAFDDLALIRIQATTDVDNVASQRVLEKNGFRREGLLRSLTRREDGQRVGGFVYGLLVGDPPSRHSTPAPLR
jgi:RimJ/RimL family protein N-acetyltransferase